ncbi:hypothetical protein LWI28_009151 [Acer negundo]|uniref:Chromo domain-containing protein n=1 Tax=Acer negundo TaxID=4023 RepID=A0AAD5ITP8_ACENE|nr:hypothetical protein LWI28_009151 [Acer negundo]
MAAQEIVQDSLPTVHDGADAIVPTPQSIINCRTRRKNKKVLAHWHGLSPADTSWEDLEELRMKFPDMILEDKNVF